MARGGMEVCHHLESTGENAGAVIREPSRGARAGAHLIGVLPGWPDMHSACKATDQPQPAASGEVPDPARATIVETTGGATYEATAARSRSRSPSA